MGGGNRYSNFHACGHPKNQNSIRYKKIWFRKKDNKACTSIVLNCRICHNVRQREWARKNRRPKTELTWTLVNGKRVYKRKVI